MLVVLRLPNNIVIVSKNYPSFLTVKEGVFSKIIPSFFSIKEGSTFLIKPLFPQEREDVAGCAIASARVLVSSAEPVP